MHHIITILFLLCYFSQTHAQDNSASPPVTEKHIGEPIKDTAVLVMPTFQGGGDEQFMKYIQSVIVYPKDARNARIQGTVYVQYIIEIDGSVSNVCVVPGKGVSPSIDQAAIDAVKSSPK
jgi:TonB family protein